LREAAAMLIKNTREFSYWNPLGGKFSIPVKATIAKFPEWHLGYPEVEQIVLGREYLLQDIVFDEIDEFLLPQFNTSATVRVDDVTASIRRDSNTQIVDNGFAVSTGQELATRLDNLLWESNEMPVLDIRQSVNSGTDYVRRSFRDVMIDTCIWNLRRQTVFDPRTILGKRQSAIQIIFSELEKDTIMESLNKHTQQGYPDRQAIRIIKETKDSVTIDFDLAEVKATQENSLPGVTPKAAGDKAFIDGGPGQRRQGGIDFKNVQDKLIIKRGPDWEPLPIEMQDLPYLKEQLKGLTPILIQQYPLPNVIPLLGFKEDENQILSQIN